MSAAPKNYKNFMEMSKEDLVDWTATNLETADLLACLSTEPMTMKSALSSSSSSSTRSNRGREEMKESSPPPREKTKKKSSPSKGPKPSKKPAPPKGPKPSKKPAPPKGPKPSKKPVSAPAKKASSSSSYKKAMKKDGFVNWTGDNSKAKNRCDKTKKLVVIGETTPKKAARFIVISYTKKKWVLSLRDTSSLQAICKTGSLSKIPPISVKDIINAINSSEDMEETKPETTIYYNDPVGLKIQD